MKAFNRYDVMDETEYWLTNNFMETIEGYLKGDAIVTNVGVFEYRHPDGTVIRELRPPEEVFDSASLNSLKMIPLTNNHPTELVNVDNIDQYGIGSTGTAVNNDSYAVAIPLTITKKDAIQDVMNGKRALSCGYTAEVEMTQGVWMGINYDGIQRNIKYNHVALVDKGRAGDLSKIKMDSKDAILSRVICTGKSIQLKEDSQLKGDSQTKINTNTQEVTMRKIILDDVEYQADEAVIAELKSAKKLALDSGAKLDILKSDSEKVQTTLQADLDVTKTKLDEAIQKIEQWENSPKLDEAEINKAVKARFDLLAHAKKAEVELKEDMSTVEIKTAVINKLVPSLNLDGKDELYIGVAFDSALATIPKKNEEENQKKILDSKEPETKIDSDVDAYTQYKMDLEKNSRGGK